MGIATLWLLPDFPSTCKWLTVREVEHIALHLHKDAPHETGHTFNRKETFDIFKDGSWYLWTTAWILQAVGGYGVRFPSFSPFLQRLTRFFSSGLARSPASCQGPRLHYLGTVQPPPGMFVSLTIVDKRF